MVRKPKARILLLEDDKDLQDLISCYYEPLDFEVVAFEDPSAPLAELNSAPDPNSVFDVVLSDLKMPKMDGIEFIRAMRKLAPRVPIVLMTGEKTLETALKAIREGAYDFMVKPLHLPQLTISIERALHTRRIEFENESLRTQIKSTAFAEGFVGKSAAMKSVFNLAKRVASSSATVLITGESGTGKEVIARTIHQQGSRRKGPFVAINCSAVPESLLESEFFGYAKGAFTGAADKKIGLFEEAEGGTLFLDEIGDLSLPLQAKLLRVIQERKIKRVGENTFRSINVRILTATHKDLLKEVREKRFREDLYFRLNVIPIHIPPLRARPDDIIPLAEYFVSKFSVQNDSIARSLGRPALEHLLKLPWRGNVRELENAIERAVVLCEEREIAVRDLPRESVFPQTIESNELNPRALLASIEQRPELPSLNDFTLEYVRLVLSRVDGVKEQAARVLQVDRKTLYRRIEEIEKSNIA